MSCDCDCNVIETICETKLASSRRIGCNKPHEIEYLILSDLMMSIDELHLVWNRRLKSLSDWMGSNWFERQSIETNALIQFCGGVGNICNEHMNLFGWKRHTNGSLPLYARAKELEFTIFAPSDSLFLLYVCVCVWCMWISWWNVCNFEYEVCFGIYVVFFVFFFLSLEGKQVFSVMTKRS